MGKVEIETPLQAGEWVREGDWARLGSADDPRSWWALVVAVVSADRFHPNGPPGSQAHRRDVSSVRRVDDVEHEAHLAEYSARGDAIGKVCRVRYADIMDARGDHEAALRVQWPDVEIRRDGPEYVLRFPAGDVTVAARRNACWDASAACVSSFTGDERLHAPWQRTPLRAVRSLCVELCRLGAVGESMG